MRWHLPVPIRRMQRALRSSKRDFAMFSKISIRTKISAVVALLLITLAGMGLVAVLKLRALNDDTVQLATKWLPSVRALGELEAGVINYRSLLREHLLAETLE